MASIKCLDFRDLNWLCMIPQVGGFRGCYPDNHRNSWRCARTVHALCPRCAKTPPKHVLGRIYMFFTLFGYLPHGGGDSPKGLVHNLLMQLFTLGSSKIEVFETCFFDIVITSNDHPRYAKHVLGRIYVVISLFCVCVAWSRFSARWTCRRQ